MPPRKKKVEAVEPMPTPTPAPMPPAPEPSEKLMHPHWDEMGRKVMCTLIGILVVYLIVFVGTLIRNNIREYNTIGYTDRMERSITLEAQGKATVKPDIAMTTIGMRAQAETVEEAQEENTRVMNDFFAGLEALGIAEEDIQTANYNVYPYYNYSEEDGRILEGYEVSQSVTVKIRETDNADAVLALAGQVGANSVGGLQFIIDDTEVYKQEARRDAMAKINKKAMELEQALGVKVVSVVSYNEYEDGGYGFPMFARAYESDLGSMAPAPDIQEGTEDVLLNVSITFEIR